MDELAPEARPALHTNNEGYATDLEGRMDRLGQPRRRRGVDDDVRGEDRIVSTGEARGRRAKVDALDVYQTCAKVVHAREGPQVLEARAVHLGERDTVTTRPGREDEAGQPRAGAQLENFCTHFNFMRRQGRQDGGARPRGEADVAVRPLPAAQGASE